MAEEERPSLELPSLGGWRRHRPARTDAPTAPEPPAPAEQLPPSPGPRARTLRLPPVGGYPAAIGTGALVGLALVALTWASLRTCEGVQGTTSCGRAGYPMLAAVLVVAVVAGALLLRLAGQTDTMSTSLLGVGLAAVLALLLLVDDLDEPVMTIVIPLLTAATYAAAHWVTDTFTEPGDR